MVDRLAQSLVLSAQDFPLARRTLRAFAKHVRVLRLAVVVSRGSRLRHALVIARIAAAVQEALVNYSIGPIIDVLTGSRRHCRADIYV